jgi:hypothetical protein
MSTTHSNDGHENWPHSLLACCEYNETSSISQYKGQNEGEGEEAVEAGSTACSRTLLICFPCILMGRTYSILENEEEGCCCLKLGARGFCCCGCAAISNCCIPICTLSPLFAMEVIYQRSRIMDQFNIHGGCSEAMKGCCCTCSLYQQYNFANEFKWRKLHRAGASFDSNTTVSYKNSFNKSVDLRV